MADKLLVNSSVHSSGRTFLAFSRDGTYTYTGGTDSLVRVWKSDSGADQEPDAALDAENSITTLCADNDGWIAGSEDSNVRRYMKDSTDMESLITRVPAIAIRCVACDPKGRHVAVTSDDLVVRVIDLEDTTNMKLLDGHKRGVRSATWHPSGNLLTTCGSDGKIIVWDMEAEEPKIEKVIEGMVPTIKDTESSEYGYDCPVLWHNSGQYFIVSNAAHEIITVSRNTWARVSAFADDEALGAITALALSVNSVYLASSCKSGIFVWATVTRRVITKILSPSEAIIHQLAFSPAANLLAWTDSQGSLTRWPDVIPASAISPINKTIVSKAGPSVSVRRQATPTLFAQDEVSTENVKDKDAADAGADIDLDDDDWIDDDLGGGMEDKPVQEYGSREMVSVTKAQPTFQPGATPFKNKRRYLSFNNIGVVEVVDQDTHHIVNVEFHDHTTRKNYHFTDHFKFDIASLGERGIVYACPPENEHPAQINYKPYSTWASQSEWSYSLPKGERAVAVAAGGTIPSKSLRTLVEADVEGNGYVVVATNKGYIRFFSGSGLQKGPVWALDGEIVSMVAGRDYVFVVHREGSASLDGNQNLKYTLRTSDTFRVLHTGRLPVNKGDTLKWIGITDEGAPAIYDSSERVMMLEHFRFTAQGAWVVLLDAKNLARRVGKDESYWPVGVSNSTFMCIILKGREEYPGFPRPLAQEIDMQMPYLDMQTDEAQKEERVARETILLDHIRDTLEDDQLSTADISRTEMDLDKEIIKLIQLACKHDKHQRAIDAAKLLHHTASFDMAVKVADFYHLPGLREKFTVLKSSREEYDRTREARSQRREWKDLGRPVPHAKGEYVDNGRGSSGRPLQTTSRAPAVHRPRLSAATPLSEPSPFARNTTPNDLGHVNSRQVSPADHEVSPPPEKRKRDEVDDAAESSDTTKRRALAQVETTAEGRATKPNPFAKKPPGNVASKPNPFAKKALETKKSMHKSESFFDKVNAAETEAEKGNKKSAKSKGTSKLTKQTTLFGLPSVDNDAKPTKSKKSTKNDKAADGEAASQTQVSETLQETLVENSGELNDQPEEETQEETQVDTQVDTQEDTQENNESKDAPIVNQNIDDEMVIDWAPTPPPMETAE